MKVAFLYIEDLRKEEKEMSANMAAYRLYVEIRAVDHYSSVFGKMAALQAQYAAAMDATQKKMLQGKAMMGVGASMAAVGAVMAYGLTKAVESAANLQQQIVNVGQAANLSGAQMSKLTDMAMTLGIKTSLSSVMTAQALGAMSQAGLPSNLLLNKQIASDYIKFADIQYNRNQTPVDESASQAVQMSHLYQIYNNPTKLMGFLNTLNAVLSHSHQSITEFGSVFRYFGGTAANLGISAIDALKMEAYATRMGVSNNARSGGSAINDFLLRSMVPASKKALVAMESAGLWKNGHSVFTDSKGNFVSMPQIVSIMQGFAKREGGNKAVEMGLAKTIWAIQGARFADSLMNPNAATAYNLVSSQVAQTASVNSMQNAWNKTAIGSWRQFKTTIQDIGQLIGMMLLPGLTKTVRAVNKVLSAILHWGLAHKNIVKLIATILGAVTAFLLLGGAVVTMLGAFKYLSALSSFGNLLGVVRIAASGAVTDLLPMIGISYLIYKAWTTNFDGIHQKVGAVLGWLGTEIPKINSYISDLMKSFGFTSSSHKSITQTQHGLSHLMGTSAQKTSSTYQNPAWAVNGVKSILEIYAAWKLAAIGEGLANTALVRYLSSLAILAGRIVWIIGYNVAISAAALATTLWTAAQFLFDAAMDADPIVWIIGLIVALVAGIILLVQHWKTVVKWVKDVWNWFTHLGNKMQWLMPIFSPFLGIPALIISKWSGIEAFFKSIGTAIGDAYNWFAKWLGIGGGSTSKPITPPVIKHPEHFTSTFPGYSSVSNQNIFQIKSTDPTGTANEVAKILQQGNMTRSSGTPNKLAWSHY